MGIDVAWVDERHELKQVVSDTYGIVEKLATDRWYNVNSYVCLRFVVPWSDAVFNQSQNVELLHELRLELGEAKDSKVRDHLQKLIRLVEVAGGKVHTYVKFIGD
jgi:hypothetical protein